MAPIIAELSPYYTISRYPNAGLERPWEGIEEETARRLVKKAEEVVKRIGIELGFE
jgi:HEPN domain-containing protein